MCDRLRIVLHNGRQVLISVDQTVNALLGFILAVLRWWYIWPWQIGRWWADETISAHSWRWHESGERSWPRAFVDTVLFWDREHCRESHVSEVLRSQSPPEQRGGLAQM